MRRGQRPSQHVRQVRTKYGFKQVVVNPFVNNVRKVKKAIFPNMGAGKIDLDKPVCTCSNWPDCGHSGDDRYTTIREKFGKKDRNAMPDSEKKKLQDLMDYDESLEMKYPTNLRRRAILFGRKSDNLNIKLGATTAPNVKLQKYFDFIDAEVSDKGLIPVPGMTSEALLKEFDDIERPEENPRWFADQIVELYLKTKKGEEQ